jgi:hypothetical protein
MPAWTASGNSGQAATTTAKFGSLNSVPVALSVARPGREPPFTVASWRRSGLSSCDGTLSSSWSLDATCRSMSSGDACREKVEAAGIAPASREALVTASTCVAGHLCVSLEAPIGKVPFGLSRHEFNSNRNRRLGSSDPTLSSPAAPRGRERGARPLLFFRQRDGDQQCCWQFQPTKRL